MKKTASHFLLFLCLELLGCSDSISDLTRNDVNIHVSDEHINIENNFNHSIYYFAVESGIAAVINWAPISTEENRIKPNNTKQIPFGDIHAFEKGNEILIYYWSEKEPSSKNIKHRSIQTKP